MSDLNRGTIRDTTPSTLPPWLAPKRRVWTALLLLVLWSLLVRMPSLDRFVTADEHAWLARSGNFYYALTHGDWAGTFQRHHPGVTVTWAGLVGYLFSYPGYAADAPGQFGWLSEEIEPFLRSQGHDPVAILAAGRTVSVLVITLALAGCFLLARRLLGGWAAFLGVGLIVFDPFHIAHSRFLHLDGLVSTLMLLAVLAWLDHLDGPQQSPNQRKGSLALTAVAAGLAWLTRSPALFLIPFFGLLALLHIWRTPDQPWATTLRSLVIGGVGALALFVLLWPAMWVDPVGSSHPSLDRGGRLCCRGTSQADLFCWGDLCGRPWLLVLSNYLPLAQHAHHLDRAGNGAGGTDRACAPLA